MTAVDWPPPYTIRRSQKSKHIRITMTRSQGLVLILPKNGSLIIATAFLDSKKNWVLKHYASALAANTTKPLRLPDQIDLPAIHQQWQIEYLTGKSPRFLVNHFEKKILIVTNEEKKEWVLKKLKCWLLAMAEQYLIDRLYTLSQATQLIYTSAVVRLQKTVWGTCNQQKVIHLNAKLLLLPTDCVDYVLLHELCHLKHLNHSCTFWALLKSFCPDYLNIKKTLRLINNKLPAWIY